MIDSMLASIIERLLLSNMDEREDTPFILKDYRPYDSSLSNNDTSDGSRGTNGQVL